MTRERVEELLAAGLSGSEIARRLGINKSTVSYHRRRLGHAIGDRCNRRYDGVEVQRFYDAGHSRRECQPRFGFVSQTGMRRSRGVRFEAGRPPLQYGGTNGHRRKEA